MLPGQAAGHEQGGRCRAPLQGRGRIELLLRPAALAASARWAVTLAPCACLHPPPQEPLLEAMELLQHTDVIIGMHGAG